MMQKGSTLQHKKLSNQVPDKLLLFDGVCNLCNTAVQLVIKHDKSGAIKFASIQSDIGQEILKAYSISTNEIFTLVFIDNQNAFVKSDGALRVAHYLSGWPKLISKFDFIPRGIRDKIYDLIAKNRYKWFGKKESCMLPTKDIAARFIGN